MNKDTVTVPVELVEKAISALEISHPYLKENWACEARQKVRDNLESVLTAAAPKEQEDVDIEED